MLTHDVDIYEINEIIKLTILISYHTYHTKVSEQYGWCLTGGRDCLLIQHIRVYHVCGRVKVFRCFS